MLQMSRVSEPGHTRDFDKCSVGEIVGALGQGLRKNGRKVKKLEKRGSQKVETILSMSFSIKGSRKGMVVDE